MGKLNEAFSSRKLADMAKQHGGIEISINGGMRNGANAFHGGSSVDVSKITDEMLIGEPFKYDYKNTPDKVAANLIHFKDGYAVSLKPYDLKSGNSINPERPRQKPSRYGTGIGDTGDHNKKESPFFKNGKKDVGPEYNGFGISSRAGESQHYREAIKNNKNDIKYYEEHPDGEYSKNAINKAKKNIQTIKGYGKELLNKRKNENKNMKQAIKLNESQLKKIVAESVKKVINEAHANCGLNSHYMDLFRNRIENAIRTNGDIKKEISQFYYDFRKVIMDKNFTLNNLAILAKDIENGTTSSANITPGASMFPSAPSFGHKEDFYESKLNRIVAESVKRVLKESFIGGDNQFDNVVQKAKSADDVFKLNYWKYIIESGDKNNGEYVLRCYRNNNSLKTRNYPDFEKVVNDLNQYYKLHGSKTIAQELPDDGVSGGRLLKITTRI